MNKLTPVALTTLTSLFVFSGMAFAEDAVKLPGTISPQNIRGDIRDIRDTRTDLKNAIKEVKKGFKKDARDLQEETKERMKVATSSEVRREIKKEFREEKKELKEERKASTAAMKAELKVLARQHADTIGRRFDVAIKQFDNLAARIQSRIDKLKTVGIDTNLAESALNTAKIAIAQAKTEATTLSDLVAQVNSASDAKALRGQVEAAVKKVNASIKSAHKALEAASKTLVKLIRSQRAAATTTKEDN